MRIPQQIADHLHVEFCFSFLKVASFKFFVTKNYQQIENKITKNRFNAVQN